VLSTAVQRWIEIVGVWDTGEVVFLSTLIVSILIMLYAMSLIHRKISLIEGEIQAMRNDQRVISEELELMARFKSKASSASSTI